MMSAFAKMKNTMEILNLLVGAELIVIGILYWLKDDISSAASWSIFGCMYIVMDKYSVLDKMSTKRRFIETIKYGSAWLGLVISTAFLIYVLISFF